MRYPPDQKANAKKAIVQAGARALRESGFHGIGVDGLAKAAGATSGAFYSNFKGKEDLLESVIDACLGQPFLDSIGSALEQRKILKEWLHVYISDHHRENPAVGCVMPTLSADVARASAPVREAYRLKMVALIQKVAAVLDGSDEERERRAWGVVAIMVGAISIASAMPDGDEAHRAINNSLEVALAILG